MSSTSARLLRNGWRVGAFDIETHGLADLKDIAAAHGTTVVTGALDVRDPVQWRDALASVCEDHLDLLVNNAGLLPGRSSIPILTGTGRSWTSTFSAPSTVPIPRSRT